VTELLLRGDRRLRRTRVSFGSLRRNLRSTEPMAAGSCEAKGPAAHGSPTQPAWAPQGYRADVIGVPTVFGISSAGRKIPLPHGASGPGSVLDRVRLQIVTEPVPEGTREGAVILPAFPENVWAAMLPEDDDISAPI
jgi:hypothetical protein